MSRVDVWGPLLVIATGIVMVGVAAFAIKADFDIPPYLLGAADMKQKILTELRGPGSSAHTCVFIVEGVELPELP